MPKFSAQQVTDLLRASREHDPDERADFLHQACGEDEALRLEVESLLAEEQSASNLLSENTPQSSPRNLAEDQGLSLVGRRLGNYHIQSFLGGGGMAKVYLARDTRLERTGCAEDPAARIFLRPNANAAIPSGSQGSFRPESP